MILAFAPRWNTTRADATGGFQLWGRRFLEHYSEKGLVIIDNHLSPDKQMRRVLDVLDAQAGKGAPGQVCVAFFCHGYRAGIQFGFKLRHLPKLARAIARLGDPAVKVPLYACDCGRDLDPDRKDDLEAFGGDGGFADRLRDRLCEAGAIDCRVDAHTTAGRGDVNPNVRRFEGGGSTTGGTGGQYIIPIGDPLWPKWQKALRGGYWYEFPFRTVGEIGRDVGLTRESSRKYP